MGAAVELPFTFVEWLVAPILFPNEAVGNIRFYRYTVGIERMDKALDCALAMLKDDVPMAAAVLRAKLRRMVDDYRRKRGDEADEYVVVVTVPTSTNWLPLSQRAPTSTATMTG